MATTNRKKGNKGISIASAYYLFYSLKVSSNSIADHARYFEKITITKIAYASSTGAWAISTQVFWRFSNQAFRQARHRGCGEKDRQIDMQSNRQTHEDTLAR